jgi:hypothetical protein
MRSFALALSVPVGAWEPSIVVLALIDTAPYASWLVMLPSR